jgi:hypothetical protein
VKVNYSKFEKPREGAGFLASSKAEGSRPDPLSPIDPASINVNPTVPAITMASLNEAIEKIRASQPTLVVSHEDYDQILSAGLPAKIQSSILVDPGQAYIFRAAA